MLLCPLRQVVTKTKAESVVRSVGGEGAHINRREPVVNGTHTEAFQRRPLRHLEAGQWRPMEVRKQGDSVLGPLAHYRPQACLLGLALPHVQVGDAGILQHVSAPLLDHRPDLAWLLSPKPRGQKPGHLVGVEGVKRKGPLPSSEDGSDLVVEPFAEPTVKLFPPALGQEPHP